MEKVFDAGNLNEKGAAKLDRDPESAPVLPVLEVQDAGELRSHLYGALADVESRADRRHESISRRLSKLENRSSMFDVPEEVKGFLVMLTLYVGVTFVLPELIRLVREWRQS